MGNAHLPPSKRKPTEKIVIPGLGSIGLAPLPYPTIYTVIPLSSLAERRCYMFSRSVTADSAGEALRTARSIALDKFVAETGKTVDGWYVIRWNEGKKSSDVWWFNAAGDEVEEPNGNP